MSLVDYKDGTFMNVFRKANRSKDGFTLIEVLMAVLLVAILATIAITQFTNFTRDTKNASTKESLGILRAAIQKQFSQQQLKCDPTGTELNIYPTLEQLQNNDITDNTGWTALCNTTEIPDASDRYFVASGIPRNPWSPSNCGANAAVVLDGGAVNSTNMAAGIPLVDGDLVSVQNCGWVYNQNTGQIKPNSDQNGNDNDGRVESSY